MNLLSIFSLLVVITTLVRLTYTFLIKKKEVRVSTDQSILRYLHSQLSKKDHRIDVLTKQLEELSMDHSKQSRLIAILETTDWEVPCPYWLKNNDHEFIYANPLYLREFNFTSDIIGKREFDIFPSDVAERFRYSDEQILLNGKDVYIDFYEGHLIIKWRRSAGKVTLGIAGIAIPSSSIDKEILLKLINDERIK